MPILLRSRLRCSLEESLDNQEKIQERLALNEVVINRGPSPYLSNLDIYVNEYLITTVQGDGLIISTPTGSTAYAMAAGASMSHPSVPCIIIAPICPHSLSFRPIVVPSGVELKVCLAEDARHTAWYSVDGQTLVELKHDHFLSISTSEFPLPSICRSNQINDWFEGLADCLHWNQRKKQLPFKTNQVTEKEGTEKVTFTKTLVRTRSHPHESFTSQEEKKSETENNS